MRKRNASWAQRYSGSPGDEVVHAFLDVMAAGQPYSVISRAMHIHPTVGEYLPTLLNDLAPFH